MTEFIRVIAQLGKAHLVMSALGSSMQGKVSISRGRQRIHRESPPGMSGHCSLGLVPSWHGMARQFPFKVITVG